MRWVALLKRAALLGWVALLGSVAAACPAALAGGPLPPATPEGRIEPVAGRGPPGQGLPPDFAAALERAGVKPQQISIWFGEADSAEARFHWLPETPRNPASVLKLVTTAQALDQLGPGYRWTTTVWAEGPLQPARCRRTGAAARCRAPGDTLDGRLLLSGGGDPRLRREDLRALFAQVRAAGIRHIRGDIELDRSAFALPPHDAGAFDGQPQRAYNVGADALLVDFAALSVQARADGDRPPQAWLEPALDGVALDNRLRAGAGACTDWRLRPLMRIETAPATAAAGEPEVRVTLEGEMPASCDAASIDIAPLTAAEYTRRAVRQAWREAGGSLSGTVGEGVARYGMRSVGEWRSPPLADLVRDVNRFSNNVMAEHLWLTAGAATSGWPATREKATAATLEWLRGAGAADAETLIDSGAGLSRRTRVTAQQLHAVLRHMAGTPLFPEFAASLPIAGEDGTAGRVRVRAHARLKTGSLNGVRAAAGYVRDGSGRWLSLVVLVEDAPTDGWRELLAWLVERAAATEGPVP